MQTQYWFHYQWGVLRWHIAIRFVQWGVFKWHIAIRFVQWGVFKWHIAMRFVQWGVLKWHIAMRFVQWGLLKSSKLSLIKYINWFYISTNFIIILSEKRMKKTALWWDFSCNKLRNGVDCKAGKNTILQKCLL